MPRMSACNLGGCSPIEKSYGQLAHPKQGWKILTGSGGSFGPHATVLNLRVFHFSCMELHLIINFPYMAVKSR